MRRGAARRALLVAAVVIATVAPACTRERDVPDPPRPRPPTAGTIRLGYPEEPPTLNPVTESSPAATDVLRAVLPSFFLVTPDLEYRPYLLAREPTVETEGSRMTVRFEIRPNARWSDGRPITVSDVRFTWRAMTDPRVGAASPEGFDHIVEVAEESPRTGTLVLSPPLASWGELFSAGRFVLPAHVAERTGDVTMWDDGPPVSGGPFAVDRWIRGRAIELVAEPRFFGPRPLASRITIEFVPDATTAIQLLEADRLDALAPMLGVRWPDRLRTAPGVEVASRFGADVVALVINARSLPSARARRSIVDSIDRDRFADVVLRDAGRTAQSVVAPEQEGSVDAWALYGTDASLHVQADEELTLVHLRTELLDLTARYIQAEVERAGGDVELLPLEADVLWERFLPSRDFDLALLEVRGGAFPELSSWTEMGGASPPLTEMEDPRLQALGAAVGREGTDARALPRAQRRLAQLAPVLPVFQPKTTVAWREGVSGIEPNPSIDGVLWNAWDWSIRRGNP